MFPLIITLRFEKNAYPFNFLIVTYNFWHHKGKNSINWYLHYDVIRTINTYIEF